MENGISAAEAQGLFEKRSSSNILSDPRILAHLRNIAEEANSSDKSEPQDEQTELEINRRELSEKIVSYNKRNQLGAFKLSLKEVKINRNFVLCYGISVKLSKAGCIVYYLEVVHVNELTRGNPFKLAY